MYDNLNVDMELKNRTEQNNVYETLQHGTRELADKTTPSAKKGTPLLLWCTLVVYSILIGLLIIAVSVSLYMCINDSKASNSKGQYLQFSLSNLPGVCRMITAILNK
jgi:hypothetical protein